MPAESRKGTRSSWPKKGGVLTKERSTPRRRPPRLRTSGMIWNSRSMKDMTIKRARKNEGRGRFHGEAEYSDEGREKQGGEQLDRRIADRYGLAAFPALAAQDQIAY